MHAYKRIVRVQFMSRPFMSKKDESQNDTEYLDFFPLIISSFFFNMSLMAFRGNSRSRTLMVLKKTEGFLMVAGVPQDLYCILFIR